MPGKLSVVATPVGNLEDITLRALRVLKEAHVVACEDTRITKKLLAHFDIHTPVVSYRTRLGKSDFPKILRMLGEGKHVALVSDAGTPGVSDPGQEIVSHARDAGALIEAIPGASALAAALSVCGLRASSFVFYGFLPLKKGRQTLLKEIAASPSASVFYESPHRIMKSLEFLAAHLSPRRRIGVYRELTKMYEEHTVAAATEALRYFEHNPDKQRGEFVVIVEAE